MLKQKQKKSLSFHSFWQELIKKELKASFCGWEQNPEGNFLKVIINGGAIYCEIGGSIEDVKSESYAGLLKDLLDSVRTPDGGEKELKTEE